MIIKPETRHYARARVFRHVGTAALFGSLALACSGSYSTQETPPSEQDDTAADTAAAKTPAASSSTPGVAPAATRPATAAPAPSASAATPSTSAAAPNTAAAAPNTAAAAPNTAAAAPNTAATPSAAASPPAAAMPTAPAAAATLSFDADIWPIFNANCAPCHTTSSFGGQSIGNADKDKALSDAKSFKDGIIGDIEDGTMPAGSCSGPPGSDGCVTAADFQKIQDWFAAGSPP